MRHLVWLALWELIRYDLLLGRATFAEMHNVAKAISVTSCASDEDCVDRICHAVEVAAIWYCKPVMCLQRSFVAIRLLRRHGIDARLIIGAQRLPFRAHAWVEVARIVVNDSPSVRERYAVLEEC